MGYGGMGDFRTHLDEMLAYGYVEIMKITNDAKPWSKGIYTVRLKHDGTGLDLMADGLAMPNVINKLYKLWKDK